MGDDPFCIHEITYKDMDDDGLPDDESYYEEQEVVVDNRK
jgi:hypothetical protein